jgi:type II secretory pathway component PulJ
MSPRAAASRHRDARAGFTLIEVVGAFFMMVVILVFVTGIFVENGRQRSAATELMRERLSATATLDLMAADLEGALFLKPPKDGDAERHPWRILAEAGGELGASAIRFVTQNAPQSNSAEHASSWIEVAYFLEEDEDGELTLWRWHSSRPPHEAANGFPDSGDPDVSRIAVGVSDFGVRLLDFEGNWVDEWDSSYLPPDQALPEAAEISVSLLRAPRRGEAIETDGDQVPGLLHTRKVAMVMRPIDVEALLNLAKGGAGGALDCFTISQCLDQGDSEWFQEEIASDCEGDDDLCDMLGDANGHCWSAIELGYPEVAARAPANCES